MPAKLRSRLPEGNGLTDELADELAANPRQILIVARIQPDDVVRHVDTGTLTTIFEISELEVVDDDANEADLHAMLRKIHQQRTGEVALFEDVPGTSAGDPAEYTRQMELARKEEAALLREKADKMKAGPERDKLEADAEAYEDGKLDEQVAARHNLIPAFTEPEGEA